MSKLHPPSPDFHGRFQEHRSGHNPLGVSHGYLQSELAFKYWHTRELYTRQFFMINLISCRVEGVELR